MSDDVEIEWHPRLVKQHSKPWRPLLVRAAAYKAFALEAEEKDIPYRPPLRSLLVKARVLREWADVIEDPNDQHDRGLAGCGPAARAGQGRMIPGH